MQCDHKNKSCVDSREQIAPDGERYRIRVYHCKDCNAGWKTVELYAMPVGTGGRDKHAAYFMVKEKTAAEYRAMESAFLEYKDKALAFDEIKDYILQLRK